MFLVENQEDDAAGCDVINGLNSDWSAIPKSILGTTSVDSYSKDPKMVNGLPYTILET